MGIISRIQEGLTRLRIVPKKDIVNQTHDITNALDLAMLSASGKKIDLSELQNITTMNLTRNQRYAIYEQMIEDGRLGAAVEMYANDTVQYNQTGEVIWVEATDTNDKYAGDMVKYINKLIKDLKISQNLWTYAYCMWLYGDVYLELFYNASNNERKSSLLTEPIAKNGNIVTKKIKNGANLERFIEKVPNPAEIYELQYKGNTSGYIVSQEDLSTYKTRGKKEIQIHSPSKYVHICLAPNISRFPETFNIITDDNKNSLRIDNKDKTDIEKTQPYTVKIGQSVLQNVFNPYQTLKLKEDSVLLERLTKSSITRIIQIEMGDLPEAQKKQKLAELKNQIEQQLLLNKESGTATSTPGMQPSENIIYTTTKNGKGTISTVNIGGDADIGNTEDITNSENKLYGSLLIPKALLGANLENTGLSNGGSLTEMNTTYARRIKRGQQALISALTDLINLFIIDDGLSDKYIGKFTLRLTPIITIEDTRRDDLLSNKIRNVSDLIELINKSSDLDTEIKVSILLQYLGTYLGQAPIASIIQKDIKDKEKEAIENPTEASKDEKTKPTKEIKPNKDVVSSLIDNPKEKSTPKKEPNTKAKDILDKADKTDNVNLAEIQGEDLL